MTGVKISLMSKAEIINELENIIANNIHIGIFISGGFDSALLLFLVKHLQQNNTITLFTVDRFNLAVYYSNKVCAWTNKKFNDSLTVNIVGNPNTFHKFQVSSGFNQAFEYGVEVILLGDTANPVEVPNGYSREKSINAFVKQPFLHCTKDKLVELAKEYGVLELLSITHSCGNNIDTECGVCWNCKEKLWAMNKILSV